MEIILLENIINLGNIGDKVIVKPGYGRNYLLKNNILVLEFDKYGILKEKNFYTKDEMNEISFAKAETENEITKENFIYNFLSSVRQKMLTKRK